MVALGELLPPVNAALNATCAVLLLTGRNRIKRGERLAHSRFMLAAVTVSAIFLISYLTRVYLTGATRFVGPSWLKYTYLTILGTHTILAMVVLPMVLRSLYLGLNKRFVDHRKIARWTYPIWVYVSVTGVIVYIMLYHLATARIPIRP